VLVNTECCGFVIFTVKMAAATSSETTVAIYKITLYHNYYTTLHFLTSLVVPVIQINLQMPSLSLVGTHRVL